MDGCHRGASKCQSAGEAEVQQDTVHCQPLQSYAALTPRAPRLSPLRSQAAVLSIVGTTRHAGARLLLATLQHCNTTLVCSYTDRLTTLAQNLAVSRDSAAPVRADGIRCMQALMVTVAAAPTSVRAKVSESFLARQRVKGLLANVAALDPAVTATGDDASGNKDDQQQQQQHSADVGFASLEVLATAVLHVRNHVLCSCCDAM